MPKHVETVLEGHRPRFGSSAYEGADPPCGPPSLSMGLRPRRLSSTAASRVDESSDRTPRWWSTDETVDSSLVVSAHRSVATMLLSGSRPRCGAIWRRHLRSWLSWALGAPPRPGAECVAMQSARLVSFQRGDEQHPSTFGMSGCEVRTSLRRRTQWAQCRVRARVCAFLLVDPGIEGRPPIHDAGPRSPVHRPAGRASSDGHTEGAVSLARWTVPVLTQPQTMAPFPEAGGPIAEPRET